MLALIIVAGVLVLLALGFVIGWLSRGPTDAGARVAAMPCGVPRARRCHQSAGPAFRCTNRQRPQWTDVTDSPYPATDSARENQVRRGYELGRVESARGADDTT